MRIAVEGCCHGELDNIYATIQQAQQADPASPPIDVLLICGDFQAIRNFSDLQSLAVPEKFRQLGGFHRYYSGETLAPFLTIVIGGNHEASNYMWELYYGGWLAPNIYYLGGAGSLLLNGIRISGASGIYKSADYRKGRFERMPYDRSSIRSIYHTREYDIARLSQLPLVSAFPTIFLSHDWPLEIERYGDTPKLVRAKPFFQAEIQSNTLGSPPLRGLLERLRPAYWFAAHLHVKFAAVFKHDGKDTLLRGKSIPPLAQQKRSTSGVAKNGLSGTNQVPLGKSRAANPDEVIIESDDEEDRPAAGAPTESKDPNEVHIEDVDIDNDDVDAHGDGDQQVAKTKSPLILNASQATPQGNPDELNIDDDDDDDGALITGNQAVEHLIHSSLAAATLTDKALTGGIDEPVDGLEMQQTAMSNKTANPDEISLLVDDENEDAPPASQVQEHTAPDLTTDLNAEAPATKFLALDKCLPGRGFLQIFDVSTPVPAGGLELTYDPSWLAILRAFHPLLSLNVHQPPFPRDPTICKAMIEKELLWVRANLPNEGRIDVADVQRFHPTAPHPGLPGGQERSSGPWYTNPQTEALCNLLQVENKINPVPEGLRAQR